MNANWEAKCSHAGVNSLKWVSLVKWVNFTPLKSANTIKAHRRECQRILLLLMRVHPPSPPSSCLSPLLIVKTFKSLSYILDNIIHRSPASNIQYCSVGAARRRSRAKAEWKCWKVQKRWMSSSHGTLYFLLKGSKTRRSWESRAKTQEARIWSRECLWM